jgi:DNA-binding CsgD family transcriptional regulator
MALLTQRRAAIDHPDINLTEKQETICRYLIENERPSKIAHKLQQSRQAVHSQISLIREKVSRTQADAATPPAPRRATRSKRNALTIAEGLA